MYFFVAVLYTFLQCYTYLFRLLLPATSAFCFCLLCPSPYLYATSYLPARSLKVSCVSLPRAILLSISMPVIFRGHEKLKIFTFFFSSPICRKLQNQPRNNIRTEKTLHDKTLNFATGCICCGAKCRPAENLTIYEYFQIWSSYITF